MERELLTLFAIHVVGMAIFGKFEYETAWWRRVLKWTLIVGITWSLATIFSNQVAFYTLLGLTAVSVVIHFAWCYKKGIHPISATPRRKYFELRGWKWIE